MPEKPSDKLLLVGGGVGTAPMLYLGEQLAKKGCKPTFLLGARSDKDLLQLEQFAAYGEVYTTTEDGSHGEKGYVTQHSILNKVCFEQIYTCGPKPMMMAVAKYAKVKASVAKYLWKYDGVRHRRLSMLCRKYHGRSFVRM